MRKAIQRGRLAILLTVLATAALGCPTRGNRVYGTAQVQPDPEAADEASGRNPEADNLGGPYGRGKRGVDNGQATVSPPVMLTPKIPDAVLVTYLNTLNFDMARDNGELALVACRSSKDPKCGARVYVQPELGMRYVEYESIPRNGVVVGRIINYSPSDSEGTYGIPPSTRAYWYVYPTKDGPRSRLFTRTPGPDDALKFIGPEKPFSKCHHARFKGPAVAKFRRCASYQLATLRGDAVSGVSSNPFFRSVSLVPPTAAWDPEPLTATELWVKCAQGCCVAGAAQD
jgi:hypothetical protein